VTVAGPLVAELWVSTTGHDADWVVKLVDEFPGRLPGFEPGEDGRDLGHTERLVRAEIFRGRYREGYDRPQPFRPGEVARVEFPLQDVLHTFKCGHRIQLQIQSSLFPFFDRNPQSWVPNIFEAGPGDFVATRHRVYHSVDYPSGLRLQVLSENRSGDDG
jgi:predicted acyl esterase